jgi:hypothetical protein
MKIARVATLVVLALVAVSLTLESGAFAGKGKGKAKGHDKKAYTTESQASSTPPGWSKGRKTGWGGGQFPPGWSKWDEKKKEKWVYDRDEAQSEIDRICVRYNIEEQKRNEISEAFDQAIVGGTVIADSKDKLVSALKNGTSRKKIVADTFEAIHDILD